MHMHTLVSKTQDTLSCGRDMKTHYACITMRVVRSGLVAEGRISFARLH